MPGSINASLAGSKRVSRERGASSFLPEGRAYVNPQFIVSEINHARLKFSFEGNH